MVLQRFWWIHCAGLLFCLAEQPEDLEGGWRSDSCQNRSCSDPNADDSALLQKQISGSAQRWHPKVYEYIRYLESLEQGVPVLLAEEMAVEYSEDSADAGSSGRHNASGNMTTAFIVLSDSNDYDNRLRWISDTWGKDLPRSQLLGVGDEPDKHQDTYAKMMRIKATQCPKHTHDGACCKEGEAIIAAHEVLEKQQHLDWAYVVDDDAYVRTAALDRQLKRVDPKGDASAGTLVALRGCSTKACPDGICGGGGIAFSRKALETMVGDRPSQFLRSHMETCTLCTMWGDVSVGMQAHAKNITFNPIKGMHGWFMEKQVFDGTLYADDEPVMYHYMKREGQHRFLDRLFDTESPATVEDLAGSYCASFKGSMMCTDDRESVPWEVV